MRIHIAVWDKRDFYPRPPGGGRPGTFTFDWAQGLFLSTPSGWRATRKLPQLFCDIAISIHALRVEGDVADRFFDDPDAISIHALRVEGDDVST